MEIRVKSLHDINYVVSQDERYELKMCTTYMYVQERVREKVLVEISLDADLKTINSILNVFGFDPIVVEEENLEEQIKKLKEENEKKDSQINRMRQYIESLERNFIGDYKLKKAIHTYGGMK